MSTRMEPAHFLCGIGDNEIDIVVSNIRYLGYRVLHKGLGLHHARPLWKYCGIRVSNNSAISLKMNCFISQRRYGYELVMDIYSKFCKCIKEFAFCLLKPVSYT